MNAFLFKYMLPVVSCIKQIYDTVINNSFYVINNLYKGYTSDILVIYDKIPTPYVYSFISSNENNGIIVWKYSRYYNTFFNYNCSQKDVARYPIISANIEEIKEDNSIKHIVCLDDFFNTLRIEKSNTYFPTLLQIIEVYAYNNGIVFDRSKNYLMRYLDDNLGEHTLYIFNQTFS